MLLKGDTDVLQLGPLEIESRLYSVYLVVMDLVVVGVFVVGVELMRKQLLRKVRSYAERSRKVIAGVLRYP